MMLSLATLTTLVNPMYSVNGKVMYVRVCRLQLGGADAESRYHYRMDHRERGKMIIINNKIFQAETKMNVRTGTDKDAASLYTDFRQLGFNVQTVQNQRAHQMLQLMIDGNFIVSVCSVHGVS